jgi:hypothetical protein
MTDSPGRAYRQLNDHSPPLVAHQLARLHAPKLQAQATGAHDDDVRVQLNHLGGCWRLQ